MAVNKFLQGNKKHAWCMIDNSSIFQSGWAKEVAKNLSDLFIAKASHYENTVYIGTIVEELLQTALDDGYTHAIVVANGTSLKLSDRLFQVVEDQCKQDFFIAGHILNRSEYIFDNSYHELHHQFYIINLMQWSELKKPFVGQPKRQDIDLIEPLGEGIKPKEVIRGKTKKYEYTPNGWNIIHNALKNDKKVIRLNDDVLNNKYYLYYEYDHVFVDKMKQIEYYDFFCSDFVNSWNSDVLKDNIDYDNSVEHYITVGTGLNWIRNLKLLNYTPSTKVTFVDNNLNVLNFMKRLVETWNGYDYATFYKENVGILPNNSFVNMENYYAYTDIEWNKFLEHFDDWHSVWKQIKELEFEYVHVDFMTDYNMDWFEPNKETVFNLSNVFNHIPFVATQSLKYRINCENILLQNIKDINPHTYIITTARASDGFCQPMIREGVATQFEKYIPADLNIPPWHEDEWNNKIKVIR